MGGNSSIRTTGPRVTTPARTAEPSKAKLDALMGELKKLTATERREAVAALKAAGLDELASALKAVAGGGSQPPERPAPTHTPVD